MCTYTTSYHMFERQRPHCFNHILIIFKCVHIQHLFVLHACEIDIEPDHSGDIGDDDEELQKGRQSSGKRPCITSR